ncbi:hypothetical protein BGZ93_000435, partial [Podila epicladia]
HLLIKHEAMHGINFAEEEQTSFKAIKRGISHTENPRDIGAQEDSEKVIFPSNSKLEEGVMKLCDQTMAPIQWADTKEELHEFQISNYYWLVTNDFEISTSLRPCHADGYSTTMTWRYALLDKLEASRGST